MTGTWTKATPAIRITSDSHWYTPSFLPSMHTEKSAVVRIFSWYVTWEGRRAREARPGPAGCEDREECPRYLVGGCVEIGQRHVEQVVLKSVYPGRDGKLDGLRRLVEDLLPQGSVQRSQTALWGDRRAAGIRLPPRASLLGRRTLGYT